MAKPYVTFKMKNKTKITREIQRFGASAKDVVHDALESKFLEMVEYAKANAVWIDRTGNARGSIDVADLSSGDVVSLYLTIGVDYGIWLELANDGMYKILQPTMAVYEPQIVAVLNALGIKISNITFTTESSN